MCNLRDIILIAAAGAAISWLVFDCCGKEANRIKLTCEHHKAQGYETGECS